MSEREAFLSGFTPLPEELTLPERISGAYTVESSLGAREDGRLILRLRRREDGAAAVLKVAGADREDLAEEFRILTQLFPLLPGAVPEPLDCFEADGTGYLLRSYLPGETLRQRREREGCCPEAQCVSLGRKLCALLEALHGQTPPVIHRDIKPENIILLPDGGVGLIDFGIARQFKDGKDSDTRHMGSRSTAAPEQYGYAQTDRRTDLYALGMTLIWLLTGEYDRDSLARAAVSPALRRTLERAAAFSPEDRYPDAAAFSAALAGQGARRRRRWGALAAAVLLLAGAVGFALSRGGKTAEPVVFTSAAMETAVRQALGQPEGEITYAQLAQIQRLAAVGMDSFSAEQVFDYRIGSLIDNQTQTDLPRGDITDADLALLAHMPELRELYLCRQEIRDCSALEGLPLTTLALCENKITDFSPLGALTELETLHLGGNPGSDYSALSALTGLKTLTVEGSAADGLCAVESLGFLDGLTLRCLGLGLTVPKDGDWSPLTRQVALEELRLWDPGEDAAAAAGTLTNLKTLTIGDYYAADLTAFSGLTGLEVLNIHKGSVESLAGVESLQRLITLAVGYNLVTDLSPLAGLAQLNYLQLEDLAITDFSVLAELPALGTLVVPQDQAALVEAAYPDRSFEVRPL